MFLESTENLTNVKALCVAYVFVCVIFVGLVNSSMFKSNSRRVSHPGKVLKFDGSIIPKHLFEFVGMFTP